MNPFVQDHYGITPRQKQAADPPALAQYGDQPDGLLDQAQNWAWRKMHGVDEDMSRNIQENAQLYATDNFRDRFGVQLGNTMEGLSSLDKLKFIFSELGSKFVNWAGLGDWFNKNNSFLNYGNQVRQNAAHGTLTGMGINVDKNALGNVRNFSTSGIEQTMNDLLHVQQSADGTPGAVRQAARPLLDSYTNSVRQGVRTMAEEPGSFAKRMKSPDFYDNLFGPDGYAQRSFQATPEFPNQPLFQPATPTEDLSPFAQMGQSRAYTSDPVKWKTLGS